MNNTVFSFLKRFAAFVTLVIAVSMTVSCTVVSPPQQQGRGQMLPQQGFHPQQQPYSGYGQMPQQMTPQQWQQLQYLQQLAAQQQVPGGNAGQAQLPHGRLSVVPGTGRTFDAKINGTTGVVSWELNGAPVSASSVPALAKQGLEQSLKDKGYSGPRITHKE